MYLKFLEVSSILYFARSYVHFSLQKLKKKSYYSSNLVSISFVYYYNNNTKYNYTRDKWCPCLKQSD